MDKRRIEGMAANISDSLFGGLLGNGANSFETELSGLDTPSLSMFEQWIQALQLVSTREIALYNLVKHREDCEELALMLWNSFGTVTILLQEITTAYLFLSSQCLTERISNRVCNTLVLLQCLASNPETRKKFIKANMPLYLFPFLNNTNMEKPYEYLRLTSLGVFGALVKADDAVAIHFLINSDVLPCCLHSMEIGDELSKTVATFVLHKILLNDRGLKYCCSLADRFFSVGYALEHMLDKLPQQASPTLLKLIVCCYLRLSETPRACDGLRSRLPLKLTDADFVSTLCSEDPSTIEYLRKLLKNVSSGHPLAIWGPI